MGRHGGHRQAALPLAAHAGLLARARQAAPAARAAASLQDCALTVLLDAAGAEQRVDAAASGAVVFRLRGLDVTSSAVPDSDEFRATLALKGFSIDVHPPADRCCLKSSLYELFASHMHSLRKSLEAPGKLKRGAGTLKTPACMPSAAF